MVDRVAELKADLYRIPEKLEAIKERIRLNVNHSKHVDNKKGLLPENQKAILDFISFLESRGMSKVRVLKYAYNMQSIGLLAEKPLEDMDRVDVQNLVLNLRKTFTKGNTIKDLIIAIKIFFKWSRNSEDYPEEVRWLKAKSVENTLRQEDLPTEEEIKRMLDACYNSRDKAFIAVLYDSGCRVGEILSAPMKNLRKKGNYYLLHVRGKRDKERDVPLTECIPILEEYLQSYPLKDNENAALFCGLGSKNYLKPLKHAAARKIIMDVAKRAGINKKMHPHLLRHARSTELSTKMSEAILNKRQGWVQGSAMPATYLHLKDSNVEDAQLDYFEEKTGESKNVEELVMKAITLLISKPERIEKLLKEAKRNPEEKQQLERIFTSLKRAVEK